MGKIEPLVIQLKFKDAGSQAVIDKVKNSLKQLDIAAKGARPRIMGLRKEILAQGQASTKSVSNINAQRSALQALRDEAKIGGKAFNKLTADIKKLDDQMAKGGAAAPKRGVGARRATQTAGAIISGGIFGGPEGAIGGALGAFGGVEGAFAGAAIGAQVGMIRQAVGDMADYAASIEKLKIALNGVLPNQNDFNFAIEAAQLATKELNIPQEQSIRGITRLSAAVTGAGGPVRDATSVFRNVTAAIKATGGSSEDVQGAITAMVQVFSKGKVSAEELSGQLGERLPGAVTMFAKANDMTLPELQKNLKAGTVGLNELMNFIHELGVTFEGTARQISDSNADAGARLSVAISEMQAEVGAALIPIGSQFQAAFADFIQKITPFLVEFLPKIGNLFLELAKRIDSFAIAAIAGFAVFGAAKLAAIVVSIGGIGAALLKLKGIMVGISLINPYTALAAGAAALGFAINENIRQQRAFNILVREGSVAEVDAAIKEKQLELDKKILLKLDAERIAGGRENMDVFLRDAVDAPINRLQEEIAGLNERRRTAIIDRDQGAAIPANLLTPFKYDPVKPDGSGEDSGEANKNKSLIARSKELLRIQTASLNVAGAQNQTEKLLSQQLNKRVKLKEQFNKLLADARGEEAIRSIKEDREQALEAQRQTQKRILDQQNQLVIDKALKGVNDIVTKNKEKLETDKEYKRLLMEGVEPSQARQIIALTKQLKLEDEILKTKIAQLKEDLANPNLSSADRQNIQGRITNLEGARGTIAESAQQGIQDIRDNPPEQKSFLEKLGSEVDEIDKRLKALVDPANQVIGAANAIGDAFSNSFMSVIKGEVSARQALANFFSSVANHFADMAAKIIAEAIKMQAIKFISSIIGSIAGSAAGGSFGVGVGDVGAINNNAFATMGNTAFGGFSAAEGAYVPGGLKPFANGGMVSQPTLGLVGEAGENEYIIPQSKMRTAMARYSRGVRGPGVIPGNGDDFSGESLAGAATAPIDVRYNVERINSVDYVTADQFQTGMQQAAQQGAKQGEQQTLKRLQMSGSTRKRIGI